MKRIAICFDGTWNTQGDKDELENGTTTNVFKLYESIKGIALSKDGGLPDDTVLGDTATIKWYDNGVGTQWYERIRGGAFGYGLSQNIREGYVLLVRHYEPGDEIYLFGFSRGAYTARSLAGLIRNSGLIRADCVSSFNPNDSRIEEAYQIYRTRDDNPDASYAVGFRKQYCHAESRIKLVGVWDTVGALGIPIEIAGEFSSKHYLFHDTHLGRHIENAFQALAIDEHRKPYAATLWDSEVEPHQALDQTWFVGAHADVGGGYPSQILSELPLLWMMEKAALGGHGLTFDSNLKITLGADKYISGKVTDSFSAFLGGIYAKIGALFGLKPYYRPIKSTKHGHEQIHEWTKQYCAAHSDYRPKNPNFSIE